MRVPILRLTLAAIAIIETYRGEISNVVYSISLIAIVTALQIIYEHGRNSLK